MTTQLNYNSKYKKHFIKPLKNFQCPAIVAIPYLLCCKMIENSQIPDKLKIGCVTPVLKPGKSL
jgi:hypothetical protein